MKRVIASFFIICFLFALFSDSSLCSLCRPAMDDNMTEGCAEFGETPACASRCRTEQPATTGCGMTQAETPSGCGGCPRARARAEAARPPCAQTAEPAPTGVPVYDPSSRCCQCVLSRLHKGFTFYRVENPQPALDGGNEQAFLTDHAEKNHIYIDETLTNLRVFPTTVLRC